MICRHEEQRSTEQYCLVPGKVSEFERRNSVIDGKSAGCNRRYNKSHGKIFQQFSDTCHQRIRSLTRCSEMPDSRDLI